MPAVPFADLARLHAPVAEELSTTFNRVLGSSAFILGEEVERFEAEFAGLLWDDATASGLPQAPPR